MNLQCERLTLIQIVDWKAKSKLTTYQDKQMADLGIRVGHSWLSEVLGHNELDAIDIRSHTKYLLLNFPFGGSLSSHCDQD